VTITSTTSGNVNFDGGINPAGLPGVTAFTGAGVFADPENGDFTPDASLGATVGADAYTRADLAAKVTSWGVTVAPSGWQTDHLRMVQTMLDNIAGVEDGVTGNETIFDEPWTYAASVREAGRMTYFFPPDPTWKADNGVSDGDLASGLYEIIVPEEYSEWHEHILTTYQPAGGGTYGALRWGASTLAQDKVFRSDGLYVVRIAGAADYTQIDGTGQSVTLDGDILGEFDGFVPSDGQSFDLISAADISTVHSTTAPFARA
jgi:hypothetical protein